MRTLARLSALFGLGACLGAAGCGAEDRGTDPVALASASIKGGMDDEGDHAVVGIYDDATAATCTGSLIAPNMVLTGRHCVSDPPLGCGTFGATHSKDGLFVTTEPMFIWEPQYFHTVAEIIPLPLDPASPDPLESSDLLCGRDQVVLLLSDNVEPSEAVPLVPRVDAPVVAEETYAAVGYGGTNDEGLESGVRRRRDGLSVTCVGAECPPGVEASEWQGNEGTCPGDSGGPALDALNRVVGVLSRGVAGCSQPTYGSLDGEGHWGAWLMETALHAAEVGGYPPPPWALGLPTDPAFGGEVGGDCAAPECTSGICLDLGEGPFCSRQCDAEVPCPAGYACDDGEHAGLCVPEAEPSAEASSTSTGGAATPNGDADEGGCSTASGARGSASRAVAWTLAGLLVLLARRRRAG